jgi:hypothetical protein
MLRPRDRGRSRRRVTLPSVGVAVVIAALMLLAPGVAAANNDPHRMFLPAGPFVIPDAVCGFPVHVEVDVNKEYGRESQTPDGSSVLKVTGSFVETFTNLTNGKSITLNASGPLTVTSPVGTTLGIVEAHGLTVVYVTNGAEFGLPNLFLTSGKFGFTTDFSSDTIVSVQRHPHVKLDICAALA